ncbi:hypothetical protein F5B18DRAFT_622982 [Nemania serpens]|nr:hypothetical protein F5B18DRAFT_622982 [Nemania serpens]
MIASTVSLLLHCLQVTRTMFSLLLLASPGLRRRRLMNTSQHLFGSMENCAWYVGASRTATWVSNVGYLDRYCSEASSPYTLALQQLIALPRASLLSRRLWRAQKLESHGVVRLVA